MNWLITTTDGVTISLRVVPRASKNEISDVIKDALKIRLQAPPVEGKANKALIKFLAKKLGVPQRNITTLSGNTNRNKRVHITGVTEEEVRAELIQEDLNRRFRHRLRRASDALETTPATSSHTSKNTLTARRLRKHMPRGTGIFLSQKKVTFSY